MTYLTFANFFTFLYAWIGAFTGLTFVVMMTRHGKNWADYDVALFRLAVSITTLAVFVNRAFNPLAPNPEPPRTWFLVALLVGHTMLAYASAATFRRIMLVLRDEKTIGQVLAADPRHIESDAD